MYIFVSACLSKYMLEKYACLSIFFVLPSVRLLSVRQSVRLSIYPYFHPSVFIFGYSSVSVRSSINFPILSSSCPSICQSVHSSVLCLPVHPSIRASVIPSVCPHVRPSVRPSVRTTICLFVRPLSVRSSALYSYLSVRPSFICPFICPLSVRLSVLCPFICPLSVRSSVLYPFICPLSVRSSALCPFVCPLSVRSSVRPLSSVRPSFICPFVRPLSVRPYLEFWRCDVIFSGFLLSKK